MTEGNAAFGHVVRGDFQRNFIAGENSDVMLTHFAVCVGNQFIAVVEFDAIASVRKNFGNGCSCLNQVFFSHIRIKVPNNQ